jgi:hypothetical protein
LYGVAIEHHIMLGANAKREVAGVSRYSGERRQITQWDASDPQSGLFFRRRILKPLREQFRPRAKKSLQSISASCQI